MRKFYFCILPFLVWWGVYISWLIPQVNHEYLGTIDEESLKSMVIDDEEYQRGNTYTIYSTYHFTYYDKYGKLRKSDDISRNEYMGFLPHNYGFTSSSKNSWIVKQLYKGKVYAPGWTFMSVIIIALMSVLTLFIGLWFFISDHWICVSNDCNYNCGHKDYCFGCLFCLSDQATIEKLKYDLIKPKEKLKTFFGLNIK